MSKVSLRILAISIFVIAVAGLTSPARAELKVAFVDVQALLTESKAAKSIQDQLGKQREKFQTDVAALEKKLKGTEQELVSLRKAEQEKKQEPSPDFLAKKAAFEKEVTDTRQQVQNRRQALEKSTMDAMNQLRKEILQIVADMATEQKYDAVFTKNDVIIASKDLDMTAAVMEKLNKKLERVDLKAGSN